LWRKGRRRLTLAGRSAIIGASLLSVVLAVQEVNMSPALRSPRFVMACLWIAAILVVSVASREQAPPVTAQTEDSRFTGRSDALDATGLRATRRRFEAGARSAWHSHPSGQLLFVEEGRARVQRRGQPLREMGRGESDYTGANVQHCGDEINILLPGRNYGWPIVSYGRNYEGSRVGSQKPWQEGFEDPLLIWVPSIAPSGMTFYTGDRFPAWKRNLFVGALRFGEIGGTGHLQRIVFNEKQEEMRRELLLTELRQRIRDVRQGPDGLLYVLTDEDDGALLRIEPVSGSGF
jgi:quercetin dioxygenase-like cupin family protein